MLKTVLAIFLSFILLGCTTLNDHVVEGVGITRTATSISMNIWLSKTNFNRDMATKYKAYILEGKALIVSGETPASALDDLAALLNSKIDSEIVRAIIQQGIETIKTRVVFPTTGIIPDSVKPWIFAVLDGAVQGIDMYLSSQQTPQTSNPFVLTRTEISFK